MGEEIFDIVRAYMTGRDRNSMAVTIPKEVRETLEIEDHEKFFVKSDGNKRLIFERLEKSEEKGE